MFDPPVLQDTAETNAPLDGGDSPSHITFCFGEVPDNGKPPDNGEPPEEEPEEESEPAPVVVAEPVFTG